MLTGRGQEVDILNRLLADREAGSQSLLVRGAWGSGKTTLLRSALAQARRHDDIHVIAASADPLERDLPFAVVRRLFENLAVDGPPGPPFAGRTAAAARALTPWTGRSSDPSASVTGADVAVLSGLYWLAAQLAEQGRLLVVIDDLQWADADSLIWLRYLLRRSDQLPLVVVATLGPQEAHADVDHVAAAVRVFQRRLTMRGLTEDAVESLAKELLGVVPDPDFTAACCDVTGGNPRMLQALLREVKASGNSPAAELAARIGEYLPADLGSAALARIQNVDPHAVTTAQAIAVLGGRATLDLIVQVTGVTETQAADAVHRLAETGWVTRAEHGLSLAIPSLAMAVAAAMLPSRRMDFHLRAARFLFSREAPLEQVAAHLLFSPLGEPWVPEALGLAAAAAAGRGDTGEAVACLRRALREELEPAQQAALLATLGELELASSVPVALRSLERSLELSRGSAERTAAARRLARALLSLDRCSDALEALSRTSEAIRRTDPANALRLEIDSIHIGLSGVASVPVVLPRLMELDIADAAGTAVQRPLAALLSLRAAMAGERPREVVELAQLGLSEGMHPVDDESIVYDLAVISLGAAGQAQLALEYADAAVTQARSRGSAFSYAHAISTRANLNCRLGRLRECQADAEAAMQTLGEIDIGACHSASVFATASLTESLIRQGKLIEAQELLTRGDLDGEVDGNWVHDYVLMVRGWLRVAQGRLDEALADFLLCGERSSARSMTNPGFLPWRSEAALAHAALRQGEAARSLAAEEVRLARIWGVPETTGVALRAMGVVVGGPEGLDMLRESVELLKNTSARVRYAQALTDCGSLARRAGRLPEARTCLQRAVSVAHECGAAMVADQALAELRAAGNRPRARTFHGVDALTPTERRVAELAERGMTNREIAQHLFVGLRTVEVHLTSVYGKLVIDGRAGLANALSSPAGSAGL